MFVKQAAAGHIAIYLARTGKQHFREKTLPTPSFFGTTEMTAILGICLAIFGIFIPPIGLIPALMVWAYALFFFEVNDIVKVGLFTRIRPYS